MNWKALAKLFGVFSWIIAGLVAFSALISLFYHEKEAFWLAVSAGIPAIGGLILMQIGWKEEIEEFSHREAILLISLSWLVAIVWGAFPYYLTKTFGNFSALSFLNSIFESTSGFTATAASVLIPVTPLENLPHGLLFWRSLSQWLGGLSVILMALLFLPFVRVGGMELFQTGLIAREKLRTKVGETSRIVLIVYFVLTFAAIVLLKIGGMKLFDAVCHSFSTISSGGFSTKTDNIGAFNSPFIETVLIVLMLLATTNFALHVSFIQKEWGAYWRSAELRLYLVVLSLAIFLIGWNLGWGKNGVGWREIIFNTVSIGSATGFWNSNISLWPSFSKALLIVLMFIGGMVGSGSGGVKCFRAVLLFKYAYREIFRIIHPAGFTPVKLEGKVVEREVLEGVAAFFFLYMTIFALGSLILQALGYDMMVAASAVASTLGGIGPGFNELGAAGGYYSVPVTGKITLILCMILGRIEIFPILVILSREFWRK